ncbi:MAG TPA: hypothetical protein VMW24_02550 [Sedimentisphaerales bacterium]|nr:hypothetical protein [Sedimentisphaerales bacterium]
MTAFGDFFDFLLPAHLPHTLLERLGPVDDQEKVPVFLVQEATQKVQQS